MPVILPRATRCKELHCARSASPSRRSCSGSQTIEVALRLAVVMWPRVKTCSNFALYTRLGRSVDRGPVGFSGNSTKGSGRS